MKFFKKLSRSVKGRVAIITGAGSGMGEATAKVFASEGVKVFGKFQPVAEVDTWHHGGMCQRAGRG